MAQFKRKEQIPDAGKLADRPLSISTLSHSLSSTSSTTGSSTCCKRMCC